MQGAQCPMPTSWRPPLTVQGVMFHTLMALGMGTTVALSYALLFVLDFSPWCGWRHTLTLNGAHVSYRYDARYIIPLAGMLLGSAVSGISVGLTTVMEELSSGTLPHDSHTSTQCRLWCAATFATLQARTRWRSCWQWAPRAWKQHGMCGAGP